MATPYLVPCLVTLRAEFNALNPKRDKGADGWIGDAAHQSRTSDHNPDTQGRVLAVDIDSTGPWPIPFNTLVESLRGDARLEYIIWNRRIASRDQGWKWRTYTGTADPHTGHAHFSARHDHTGNTSTADWGIETMAIADDVTKIRSLVEYDQKVLSNIQVALQAIAGKLEVPTSDVLAAVGNVDEEVLARLGDAGRSDEDLAAGLRAVLGDRAAAVGRLLAA